MYLVTADEMREMDQETIESFGIPGRVLMENAGRGAARILLEKFCDLGGKRVGVIAGRGNNGGDGFVIARYLSEKGIKVTVYLLSTPGLVKGDAAANLGLLAPLGIPVIEMPDLTAFQNYQTTMRHQDIWVDAILGTGLKSDVKGYFKEIIRFINQSKRPVFAVDIPSGLDSDTGQPCGTCIRATVTATFAFAKTGHLLFPGADYTGDLEIVDIGIPSHIAQKVGPLQYCLTPGLIRDALPSRSPDAHKGHTGHLMVVAGSPGKTGAAAMTAVSAMRVGAGLVTLGIPKSLNAILETRTLEVMTSPLPDTREGVLDETSYETIMGQLSDKKCIAIGPGLGIADGTKALVHRIIKASRIPVVVDADGLNCLVGHTRMLKKIDAPLIMTPHPGEMARLIETTTRSIQKDRVACARDFAKKVDAHVVLKGARTVIAHPDGRVYINPTGNPGMASGGMGDVLTGMVAGLITQGQSVESAVQAGVYLHGAAADTLSEKMGPFGFLAGDVMNVIPEQISLLLNSD